MVEGREDDGVDRWSIGAGASGARKRWSSSRDKGFGNMQELEVMPENVRFGLPPEIVEAIAAAPASVARIGTTIVLAGHEWTNPPPKLDESQFQHEVLSQSFRLKVSASARSCASEKLKDWAAAWRGGRCGAEISFLAAA